MCVQRDLASRNAQRLGIPTDTPYCNGVYQASTSHVDSLRGLSKTRTGHVAVLDTGATRSVMGLPTARRLARSIGRKLDLCPSPRRFRFGVTAHESMGSTIIHIPTPSGVMSIQADVISADVPFLIGMDAMDANRVQVLSIDNKLEHIPLDPNALGWQLPLARKHGHICLPFLPIRDECVSYYTRTHLERLHRSMYHPSAEKMLELLRRADPDKLEPETRSVLQDISRSCHACQAYSPPPLAFKVSMPGDQRFNRSLRLDLFFINDGGVSYPALHVVDTATHFQAAVFLPGQSAGDVWNALLLCWSRLFVGDPEEIVTDQGVLFTSKEFTEWCAQSGITLRHTPTEQHNSLSVGETYHHAVRKVFLKLRAENPNVSKELLLQLAVYAINTSTNPHGLIPVLLVFGVLPRLPDVGGTGPKAQSERMEMLNAARQEYDAWVCQRRIDLGIRSRTPSTADEVYETGDRVYVWREKPRMWTGPFKISSVDGKSVYIKVDSKGPRPFSITRVKRVAEPTQLVWENEVLWTEVIGKGDERSISPEMLEAKRSEFVNLLKRGTFKLVMLPDGGRGENVVPGRFVLALKHATTGETKAKARFVIGGHRDKEKGYQVHVGRTLSQSSVRMLLALAAILGFDVWTEDIKQAYLQSASALRRRIFVKPGELHLGKDEFLQLILPLYGLSESGDYWSRTLTDHCLSQIGMQQTSSDLSLFFRRVGHELVALSGNYVDDLLRAAPKGQRPALEKSLRQRFECGPSQDLPSDFLGMELSRDGSSLKTAMSDYISRLKCIPDDASYQQYASLRASLLWLAHVRPDISAFGSIIGSYRQEDMSAEVIKMINEKVKFLKSTKDVTLTFPALDRKTLRLVVYSDASFANRKDKTSQLGYVVCLADASGKMSIVSYRSCKSPRVARSAMAAETLAFTTAFDAGYVIRHQLQTMLQVSVPMLMLIDSKSLFDVITSNRNTEEGRLMIDIFAARQAYGRGEIDNIGLVAGEHNIADDLTKLEGNGKLFQAMNRGVIDHPIRDYILR